MKINKYSPCLFSAFLVLFLVVLFHPVHGYYSVLVSPDSAPYYRSDHLASLLNRLTRLQRGIVFYPGLIPSLVLPPLIFHDWHYALCALATCAATVYYLRGLRLNRSACFCGGFAMAFSGYHFTLVSAGHRGYFDMVPWAIMMIAWMDRGGRRPGFRFFASAAIAAAFGLSTQPDVMILFIMLAVCHGCFSALATLRRLPGPGRHAWARRFFLGLAAAIPVAVLANITPLGWVFQVLVPGRQTQIAESAAPAGREHDVEEKPGNSPDDAWIFATNWSLPPGESLEFVAPFFFGIETRHPDGPYWGALGRSPHWSAYKQQVAHVLAERVPEEQRARQRDRMLTPARNLRQHTTYLGGAQLLFSLAVLLPAWSLAAGAKRKKLPESPGSSAPSAEAVVRFWSLAALFSLLLAFGRHTPVYRLFYHLPMMSHLRAPVKFLHLTELAVAVMFAFGVHACFSGGLDKKRLRPVLLLGAAGALVLLSAAAFPFWQNAVRATMDELGVYPATMPLLLRLSRRALLHGGLVVGAACALILAGGGAARRGIGACLLLLPLLAVDSFLVCRPYLRARDVSGIYRPNQVVDTIRSDSPAAPYRVSNLLGGHEWEAPLSGAMRHHGIPRTEPSDPESRYGELHQALSTDPARLWSFTGTRFIIGLAGNLATLRNHPGFRLRMGFDLDRRTGAVRHVGREGPILLFERADAEPYAQVFHDWEVVEKGQALAAISEPEAPYRTRLWIENQSLPGPTVPRREPEPAATRVRHRSSLFNRTLIRADSQTPAILLVRASYGDRLRATVNGQPAPLLRANHLWCAIPLPGEGGHRVSIQYGATPRRLVTGGATFLILGWLWLVPAFPRRRAGQPAKAQANDRSA